MPYICSASMGQVYEEHKDEDGFLYIAYSGENTFGHWARRINRYHCWWWTLVCYTRHWLLCRLCGNYGTISLCQTPTLHSELAWLYKELFQWNSIFFLSILQVNQKKTDVNYDDLSILECCFKSTKRPPYNHVFDDMVLVYWKSSLMILIQVNTN